LGVLIDYYADAGCCPNDSSMAAIFDFCDNAYKCANWHLSATLIKTNTPANTSVRSPGTFPAISIMEYIMENVASTLGIDPVVLKFLNLYKKGDVTPDGIPLPYFNVQEIMTDLSLSSDYNNRYLEIFNFNLKNRWKKRGISMVPLKWGAGWRGMNQSTYVAIYSDDGSVAVVHGGVECGQGINTKVAQVCAYELGIPIEYISIKNPDTVSTANSAPTGGSVTSEVVCAAIIECCKQLNSRLDPIRKTMPDKYTWEDLISKASSSIDLRAYYYITPKTPKPEAYFVYAAAVSEAIVDVLTGETQILRTDILYDGGKP
jgi:xanthine dehydrogenase/oxidase